GVITDGKGSEERYVPVVPELTHELRTYLRDRTTGPLFETRRHTSYSPRRIQQLVQETAALAGITKRVHPHLLRHSVATTLLERGMALEQIQQFLGHAGLETTQIYAESTAAMIKESYQKALGRGGERVRALLSSIDNDPLQARNTRWANVASTCRRSACKKACVSGRFSQLVPSRS